MKQSTIVSLRCESIGRPKLTETFEGISVRDAALKIGNWLLLSYMGSHMRITVARSLKELEIACASTTRKTEEVDDLMGELRAVMDQEVLALDDSADDGEMSLLGDDE